MTFIDVHCHIEMCKGKPEEIVKRAKKAGVSIMINQGVNTRANRKCLELASKLNEIKPALGIYPLDALKLDDEKLDEELDFIRKNREKIVALGEIGLDFKEDLTNRERQKEIFQKIINLSFELDIPLIVHSRKAEKECIEMLEKAGAKKVVMHCFSGNFGLVKKIIENGWFFSIPASIKFSEHFQKLVKECPISQLFCETDSPYLHPDKERDNEPMNVAESYKKIAEIKGISLKECEREIEKNYKRLF